MNGAASKSAAVGSARSQEVATLSGTNAVEESSEVERLATAGALDGDASNLTVALVQKDATIKTKNVQPNEFLGAKRCIETIADGVKIGG